MNSARIDIETDRLGPAAQAPPRIDSRLAVVAVLLCVVFACFFVIGVIWLLESVEPDDRTQFDLTVESKNAVRVRPHVEQARRRQASR